MFEIVCVCLFCFWEQIRITSSLNLIVMPLWISQNASIENTIDCGYHPPVVIRTKTDYDKYAANSTLLNSVDIGTIIITWADISNEQLALLLQTKTTIDELIIEDCLQLTSLSPALDALQTVSSRLSLDNLTAVPSITLGSLTSVGAVSVRYNTALETLEMPKLKTVGTGGMLLYVSRLLTSLLTPSLVSSDGSLIVSNCLTLTAAGVTAAFPSLQTVAKELQFTHVSYYGPNELRDTDLVLPRLKSVGSLLIQYGYTRSIVMPRLESVAGTFRFNGLNTLHYLDMPSISYVGGTISFYDIRLLSSLCHFDLSQAGFNSSLVSIFFALAVCASLAINIASS